MSKCYVDYIVDENGEQRWSCKRFMLGSTATHPMSREECYYYKCPGRNPQKRQCVRKGCTNPKAPNKHRHCSEVCRKRDNRDAYKRRKKQETANVQ